MQNTSIKPKKINQAVRHCTPLVLSLLVLWALRDHLPALDFQVIFGMFHAFELLQWLLALGFTALSLTAVGFYDVTAAKLMRLPVTRAQAFAAGWRATAIAQTLGFGVVTGSLVRWKLLQLPRKDGLWTATKMTTLVTASFLYGWLIVAGLAATLAPGLPDQIWWLGLLALWFGLALAALSVRASPHALRGFPPIIILGRVAGLTFVDTLAASIVIFCFLPDGYAPFLPFYISFLVAYSIGMISGVPGGVGPFEMCLIALLTPTDPMPLMAALIAYRATYFLLPAAVAGLSLITPMKKRGAVVKSAPPQSAEINWPAEAALVRQGPLKKTCEGSTGGLSCQTHNSEIYLRDPVGPSIPHFLTLRRVKTRKNGQRLLLYKCTARVAVQARKTGLTVLPISSEAVLAPAKFSTNGKPYAQLRRKLRKAQADGVTFTIGAPRLSEMQDIDRAWQARNGPARGFSVGQFSPNLVSRQVVFTAFQNGEPIAYVTCHSSEHRWVLDLMRSKADCPNGTMQGLVLKALSTAQDENISEFSLCTVPFFAPNLRSNLVSRVLKTVFSRSRSAKGLWRFKSGFNPTWRREFIAFDGPLALLLGTYDLAQLISNPAPIIDVAALRNAHDHYDNYEFASIGER